MTVPSSASSPARLSKSIRWPKRSGILAAPPIRTPSTSPIPMGSAISSPLSTSAPDHRCCARCRDSDTTGRRHVRRRRLAPRSTGERGSAVPSFQALAQLQISDQRKRCSHVFIGSLGSSIAIPRGVAYAASKSALLGIVRTLATEWAPYRIRVNAVAPGYFLTELTRELLSDAAQHARVLSADPDGPPRATRGARRRRHLSAVGGSELTSPDRSSTSTAVGWRRDAHHRDAPSRKMSAVPCSQAFETGRPARATTRGSRFGLRSCVSCPRHPVGQPVGESALVALLTDADARRSVKSPLPSDLWCCAVAGALIAPLLPSTPPDCVASQSS